MRLVLDTAVMVAAIRSNAGASRRILEAGLETAANGNADAIVTFNTRDFHPQAGIFGIEVLSPGQALNRMEKQT